FPKNGDRERSQCAGRFGDTLNCEVILERALRDRLGVQRVQIELLGDALRQIVRQKIGGDLRAHNTEKLGSLRTVLATNGSGLVLFER
ncbi:MAG: hypothetical protein ACQESR_23545, partial [Planctomycetota bacterium]